MLRRTANARQKQGPAATQDIDPSATEQALFERVTKKALGDVDAFVADTTQQKATILFIDNIERPPFSGWGDSLAYVSPEHATELIEAIYKGLGVEDPGKDLAKWAYQGTEHVAVTPTSFGNIAETRFRLEESDPLRLPQPQECGMYTLELVRSPQ